MGGSAFLHKLHTAPACSTILMAEVASFACHQEVPEAAVQAELHEASKQLFSGWGQTKLIEDGRNKLCGTEQRHSQCSTAPIIRQWASLRDEQVVASHHRAEIDLEVRELASNRKLPEHLFVPDFCRCSLEGCRGFVCTASRPVGAAPSNGSRASGLPLQVQELGTGACLLAEHIRQGWLDPSAHADQ